MYAVFELEQQKDAFSTEFTVGTSQSGQKGAGSCELGDICHYLL